MPDLARDGRIRVGFISASFGSAPAGMYRGFIERLDRSRFEVHCYLLGHGRNDSSASIEHSADHFERPIGSIDDVCRSICKDLLHVLIYPNLGTHGLSRQLAALRLAAVQCAMSGHPATTGLPSIDYFLSPELMEGPDADAHYTERLIPLANHGLCLPRPEMPAALPSRSDLGLPGDVPLLVSCAPPQRRLPQFDSLYVRLLDESPQARLVIVNGHSRSLNEQFKARLCNVFEHGGLDPLRHCIFIDQPGDPAQMLSVLAACDICLDNPGWSGLEMSTTALGWGVPIVTMPGQIMRSRRTGALLTMLELDELIAADEADYVRIAARLVREPDHRRQVKAAIIARSRGLFDDPAPVRSLEAFLDRAVRAG